MAESKLRDLSTEFAVNVLVFSNAINSHQFLVNQLQKSATSIGANVREANYASSKADFVSKLQIALKECYETEYWFELLEKAEIVDHGLLKDLINKCGTIRRLLVASVNTAKKTE